MSEKELRRDREDYRELLERATKDKLSDLLTRATAESYIEERLSLMRSDESCAVMIIDLDDFKLVNDTYGHQSGDEVIIHTARALSGSFRTDDIVSRWGGDEFLVFLSGSLNSDIVHNKAREVSEKLQFIIGQDPGIAVSASIGIYIETTGQRNFREMFRKADEALYSVKRTGKHGISIKMDEKLLDVEEDKVRGMRPMQISDLHEGFNNGIALLEVSDEIEIIYVNSGFCTMLEEKPENFAYERPLQEIVHPDDWTALSGLLHHAVQSSSSITHVVRFGKEGAWNWWNIKATHINYPGDKPVLMMVSMDISSVKNSELELQKSNTMYEEVLGQNDSRIFEVDIPHRLFTLFAGSDKHKVLCQLEFPEGLISSGLIAEESHDRLTAFADLLLKGVQGKGDNFLVRDPSTNQSRWASLSYNVTMDDKGEPARAIGIFELLNRNEMEEESDDLLDVSNQMERDDILFGMICDLSEDKVEEFWYEGMNAYGSEDDTSCSEVFARIRAHVLFHDNEETGMYFDLYQLRDLYMKGKDSFLVRLEYQMKDKTIQLLYAGIMERRNEDGHVMLYGYVNRLDRLAHIELEEGGPLSCDPYTGYLTEESFRKAAEYLIRRRSGRDQLCAFAVVQLRNITGKIRGMRKGYVASAISLLKTRCIFAFSKSLNMLIFFEDIRSRAWLSDKLEKMIKYVRGILHDEEEVHRVTVSIGVSCSDKADALYDDMYAQAMQGCDSWKNLYKDGIIFPEESGSWTWREIGYENENDKVVLHRSEMDRPLSSREKDAAFGCVTAMLKADSEEQAVDAALQSIGRFYEADRVYLLRLARKNKIVIMSHEWSDVNRRSIQHALSGTLTNRLPILQRCLQERKPVYLTRRKPFENGVTAVTAPWHFTVFPMIEKDEIYGFLCIDNPKVHAADGALLYMLMPYIKKQERKAEENGNRIMWNVGEEGFSYSDPYQFDLKNYKSVGLVFADMVPDAENSSQQGLEYHSRLLWYLQHEMEDIFGRECVFHTGPKEFAALSFDSTKQVFMGRTLRLRARVQRMYPGQCRIGSSYREGIFYTRMLVDEAHSALYLNPTGASLLPTIIIGGCSYGSIKEAADMGRLRLFAQPVYTMGDNSLHSIEVLLRGVDPRGSLILPSRFLVEMERNGVIRDVDLYMLEETLAWMEKRKGEGRNLPQMALNISLKTLRNRSAFASYLAVASRYPAVMDEPLIFEIRINEHTDVQSLVKICQPFMDAGVQFALDDYNFDETCPKLWKMMPLKYVKLSRNIILEEKDVTVGIQALKKEGVRVIVKGIENAAQEETFRNLDVLVQGDYYRKAASLETFTEEE